MLPDLSALTEGVLPDDLRKLVGRYASRTNPLRFAVLVHQKKEDDKNFVRLRVRSNIRSLLRLMEAWHVPKPVQISTKAMHDKMMHDFAENLGNEIERFVCLDLEGQGLSEWIQEDSVSLRPSVQMEPITHFASVHTWSDDNAVDSDVWEPVTIHGYDISEDAWEHFEEDMDYIEYEHVDLFDVITQEVMRSEVLLAWRSAVRKAQAEGAPIPRSQKWTVRTASLFDGRELVGVRPFWYKVFYVEKEITTMLDVQAEKTKPDMQSGMSAPSEGGESRRPRYT